jgi:O-antigen/teichoic acid export membrane protein
MKQNFTNLVSIAFVGGLVGRGLRYGFNIVIARGLGPDALGVVAFGLVVMKAISVVTRMGLDQAAQKYIPIYLSEEEPALVSGTTLLCIGLPTLVGAAISGSIYLQRRTISNVLGTDLGVTTQLFLVGVPLFSTMMVAATATRGFKETKYYVYTREIGQSIVAFVLAVVGAYVLSDVQAVIFGYLISLGFGAVLAISFLSYQGAFSFDVRPSVPLREVLGFALPLTIAAVTLYLVTWTDILMLGLFRTPTEVGWYQAAYQTSVLLSVVLQATFSIFPTLASDLYHTDQHERLGQIYTVVTKWVVALTLFGFLFLLVFLESILGIFGTTIRAAETALSILAVGQLAAALVGPAGLLLTMSEYERLQMVNSVLVSLLNIALNYILIQEFGIVGAAIATGVSFIVLNVLRLVQTWYLLGIQPYSRDYWRGLAAVAGAFPIMLLGQTIPLPTVLRVLLTGVVSTTVFAALVWYFGFSDEDVLLLESLE